MKYAKIATTKDKMIITNPIIAPLFLRSRFQNACEYVDEEFR
ncbi:MAG TPA: hypothetical protein VF622_02695 [Segetibacter sp.]